MTSAPGTIASVTPPSSPNTSPYTAVLALDNGDRVLLVTKDPPQTPQGGRVLVTVAVQPG